MSTNLEDEFDLLPRLDDRPGPAVHIGATRTVALVASALRTEAAEREPQLHRGSRRRRIAWIAAVACAVAVTASASVYQWARSPGAPADPADVAAPPVRPERNVAAVPAMDVGTPAVPTDTASTDERAVTPKSPRRERTAQDQLRAANAHRRAHRWRRAERLYREVARAHRDTVDGYVARVAAASIRLEHLDDPRTALRLYRAAFRDQSNGPLAEEVRFGIAECYRALGDPARETRALEALLDAHPDSTFADRARRRLTTLAAQER